MEHCSYLEQTLNFNFMFLKYLIPLIFLATLLLRFIVKSEYVELLKLRTITLYGDKLLFNKNPINYVFIFVSCFLIFNYETETLLFIINFSLVLISIFKLKINKAGNNSSFSKSL
jgi:hypothetical protein